MLKKCKLTFEDYWGFMCLTLPAFFHGPDLRIAKDFATFAAITLSFLIFGINPRAIHKYIKYPLIGILLLALFNNLYLLYPEANFQVLSIFFGLLFFAQCFTHFSSGNICRLSKWLGTSCIIYSLWMIANRFGMDPYNTFVKVVVWSRDSTPGAIGNSGLSAGHVVMLMPFISRRYWYLYSIPLLAIYFSGNSTAWVCVAGATITYLIYRFKPHKCTYGILGVSFLTGLHFLGPYLWKVQGIRLNNWISALRDAGDTIFGRGVGWIPVVHARLHPLPGETFRQLHNEFLELYVIMGLAGILLVGFVSLISLKQAMKSIPLYLPYLLSLVIILIYSFFWFPMHIGPMSVVVMIVFAVMAKRGTID